MENKQRIMIYKASQGHDQVIYEDCDFVLASYEEVRMSCAVPDPKDRKQIRKDLQDVPLSHQEWVHANLYKCGILHKIKWFRVGSSHCVSVKSLELFVDIHALDCPR
jgi:hypothetical protein